MKPLPESLYLHDKVTHLAKLLLGKMLVTFVDGGLTSGLIVETEAYSFKERGCHAFNNKITARNKVMFEKGGIAYIYLCYGVHNLFNIVTNKSGKAEAVLIRALQPVQGEQTMLHRMKSKSLRRITSGPGKLTKALGIDRKLNGASLVSKDLWLEEGIKVRKSEIVATPRIGIDYAGEDAALPWRFYIRDNAWVSKLS